MVYLENAREDSGTLEHDSGTYADVPLRQRQSNRRVDRELFKFPEYSCLTTAFVDVAASLAKMKLPEHSCLICLSNSISPGPKLGSGKAQSNLFHRKSPFCKQYFGRGRSITYRTSPLASFI
ncbi:hypothetical protein SLE2022_070970 [Rubroshorea leprosula]